MNDFIEITDTSIDPKLKRAHSLVGFSNDGKRPRDDFYVTPPEATEALLRVEQFVGEIWECACGDGSICRVLEKHGYKIKATDLIDRGYGEAPHDFLTSSYTSDNIITNPPYVLGQEFVELGLKRITKKSAFLMKLAFLEGEKRRKMFQLTPLKKVWVFSKRLTMTRNRSEIKNSGMIAFGWYVFEHGYKGEPKIGWI